MKNIITLLFAFALTINSAVFAQGYVPSPESTPSLATANRTTSGTVTLDASSATYQFATHGTGVVTYNLPIASTCPGKRIWISYSLFGGTVVINRQGSDTIITGTTLTLQNGEFIGLISSGSGRWAAISMSMNSNNTTIGNTASNGKWQMYSNNLVTGTTVGASSTQPIFRLDASGGAVLYTLLSITAGDQDLINIFVRTDSSANTCTIQRGGDDTIGNASATSITLPRQGSYVALQVKGGTGGDTGKWRVFAASPDVYGQLQGRVDFDHDIRINTIGKGLQIKTGTNGLMGTTAAMVAGTITTANTSVLTGDLIFASRVSGAGVSAGITSYSIVNATSFTLNGAATDDGVYNFLIMRPAP